MIPAQADRQEYRERQHGGDASGANHRQDARAVLSGRRVVVVAEEQHVVDDRADALVGRLDQAEPEIARRELDPVEVLRDGALRRQHLDRRAVRELPDLLVVRVAEADGVGQRVDRCLRPGQEVPAAGRLRPAVALDVARLLLRRQARAFLRVEADRDDVELAAGLEVQDAERRRPGR